MLDIKFIKENKDFVREATKNKNRDIDIDEILELYEERKNLKIQIDEVNAERKSAATERNIVLGTELKLKLEKLEKEYLEKDKLFVSLMLKVPNIHSVDTPVGPNESSNKVIRQWGEPTKFNFSPREHDEIGKILGIIDTETASTVAGARFSYLKGDLVLMQFALIQFALSILVKRGFTPVLPPVFIKPAVQNRMARFMTPEEHYMFPNDDLMLIGSAEHTLGPMFMDKTFKESELPIRLVGFSTAFRREAGSYGKDTKGILRQHQFDKLEMESFTLPEESLDEQELLVSIQEEVLQALNLPYQVVLISSGDMGFPDYRQIDIETWMPGQNKYRETHSADHTGNFQSRRLNTRVKRADGSIEPVHMNDATVIALGRTLIAIIENYQEEDGSVRIPEVLQSYMGGVTKITPPSVA